MRSFRQLNPAFQSWAGLSMFFHSLGNYYLEYLVLQTKSLCGPPALFDNLALNAAAVNQDQHQEWVEKLFFNCRIYITSNVSDFNLKRARFFTKDGKQTGEKIKLPLAENAKYVNFKKPVGFRLPTWATHTYFIGNITDMSLNIHLTSSR
jgi:hypothetical protein